MTEGLSNPPTSPIEAICPETIICLDCGYNLQQLCTRENSRGQCPECGAAFDLLEIRRAMAKLPANMTLSDQMFLAPVAAGILLSVCQLILSALLISVAGVTYAYLLIPLLLVLVVLLIFSMIHGRSLAHIDMINNWRRHARGEVEELHGFRVSRWALFTFTDFFIGLVTFILSSCCMAPVIS